MKKRLNNKGAAIILVIASIVLLTMISLDMFDDALVGHQLAKNYSARVKGYYLAKSAINFSKMLLYYNKQVDSSLEKKGTSMAALGQEPLYKQLPLSSEALRAMVMMQGMMGGGGEDSEDTEDETKENDNNGQNVGMLQKESVEEFLGFDGDFYAEISEEQSKHSINAVSKMTSTSTSYDLNKKVLLSILLKPEFKNYFKNQSLDAETLVHAIADYVDANNVINEFDQVERGNENSLYDDENITPKQGAAMTLSELRLVPGMSDDIYEALKPYVTVYHTSEKINVCVAEPEIVDALIIHYTTSSNCTSPLDAEKDADEVAKLRDEMLMYCPDKTNMANTLNVGLGITSAADVTISTTGSSSSKSSSSSKVDGCDVQFEDLISTDNNIFRVLASGTVDDVTTTIEVVLDTSNSKANKWPVLYYQIH